MIDDKFKLFQIIMEQDNKNYNCNFDYITFKTNINGINSDHLNEHIMDENTIKQLLLCFSPNVISKSIILNILISNGPTNYSMIKQILNEGANPNIKLLIPRQTSLFLVSLYYHKIMEKNNYDQYMININEISNSFINEVDDNLIIKSTLFNEYCKFKDDIKLYKNNNIELISDTFRLRIINTICMVKLLLNHGADPNILNYYNESCLHSSYYYDVQNTNIIKYLLENNANPLLGSIKPSQSYNNNHTKRILRDYEFKFVENQKCLIL